MDIGDILKQVITIQPYTIYISFTDKKIYRRVFALYDQLIEGREIITPPKNIKDIESFTFMKKIKEIIYALPQNQKKQILYAIKTHVSKYKSQEPMRSDTEDDVEMDISTYQFDTVNIQKKVLYYLKHNASSYFMRAKRVNFAAQILIEFEGKYFFQHEHIFPIRYTGYSHGNQATPGLTFPSWLSSISIYDTLKERNPGGQTGTVKGANDIIEEFNKNTNSFQRLQRKCKPIYPISPRNSDKDKELYYEYLALIGMHEVIHNIIWRMKPNGSLHILHEYRINELTLGTIASSKIQTHPITPYEFFRNHIIPADTDNPKEWENLLKEAPYNQNRVDSIRKALEVQENVKEYIEALFDEEILKSGKLLRERREENNVEYFLGYPNLLSPGTSVVCLWFNGAETRQQFWRLPFSPRLNLPILSYLSLSPYNTYQLELNLSVHVVNDDKPSVLIRIVSPESTRFISLEILNQQGEIIYFHPPASKREKGYIEEEVIKVHFDNKGLGVFFLKAYTKDDSIVKKFFISD